MQKHFLFVIPALCVLVTPISHARSVSGTGVRTVSPAGPTGGPVSDAATNCKDQQAGLITAIQSKSELYTKQSQHLKNAQQVVAALKDELAKARLMKDSHDEKTDSGQWAEDEEKYSARISSLEKQIEQEQGRVEDIKNDMSKTERDIRLLENRLANLEKSCAEKGIKLDTGAKSSEEKPAIDRNMKIPVTPKPMTPRLSPQQPGGS